MTLHYFRNLKSTISLTVCLAVLTQSTAMASPKPLELQWSELSSRIEGRTIELILPDGTFVGGEVTVVRAETLVLEIRRTSDSKTYPKGSLSIPKASVTLIKLIETHGQWGRKMGSGLGFLAGALVGGYIAEKTSDSGGTAAAIFGAIAGSATVAGYYIGKSADARHTLIRVLP